MVIVDMARDRGAVDMHGFSVRPQGNKEFLLAVKQLVCCVFTLHANVGGRGGGKRGQFIFVT